MKDYNIDIATDGEKYYIFDFTITRPLIGTAFKEDVMAFANGYKTGIEIDSKLLFQPKINEIEKVKDIEQYIKDKKKYYDKLWSKQ